MNKRNKIFLGMALAAAMLPMAACTDDVPQTIRLEVATETAGAKMTLSGRYTYFEEGDIVKINNQPYALASDGSGGYHWADVQFPQEGNCFTAFFPASLQAQDLADFQGGTYSDGQVYRTVRVKLPRVYNYTPATGKIDIPMVALAKLNSPRLHFKHMCAVIGLTIDNQATGQVGNIGRVRIDSVRFSINGGTQDLLSGEYSIGIADDGGIISGGMSAQSSAPNAASGFKRVSVHLPASSYMENQLTIPVPIPPVASGKTLTVTLYGWNHLTTSTSSSMRQFTYSADFTLTRAITRNQYVSATATLNGEGMNFFMFIDNGIESHDNNGNLW